MKIETIKKLMEILQTNTYETPHENDGEVQCKHCAAVGEQGHVNHAPECLVSRLTAELAAEIEKSPCRDVARCGRCGKNVNTPDLYVLRKNGVTNGLGCKECAELEADNA